MYSSTHSIIGTMTFIAIKNDPISIVVAILSHFLVDILGERAYGNIKESIIIELVLNSSILILAFTFNNLLGAILGIFFANLVDIIDKFRFYVLKKEQIFACHKPGYPLIDIKNWKNNIFIFLFLFFVLALQLFFFR